MLAWFFVYLRHGLVVVLRHFYGDHEAREAAQLRMYQHAAQAPAPRRRP